MGDKVVGAWILKNAIDTEKYVFNDVIRKQVLSELQIPKGMLVLGTVGRLTFQKNPSETIRICEELKKRGVNFVFLWVHTTDNLIEL